MTSSPPSRRRCSSGCSCSAGGGSATRFASAFRRPYILFCIVYTAIFTFAWSAFANLGALARQRVQVWPFLLILVAMPLVRSEKAAGPAVPADTPVSLPAADAAGRPRVLLVTASARRRGAEIQASQFAEQLGRRGPRGRLVALSAGTDGVRLPVAVLGRRRLGPRTLWRLRRRARHADVVVAYGSSTLPACIIALAGRRTTLVYRSISDPGHWLRGPVHRFVTRFQYRRPAAIAALWDGAAASITTLFGVPPPGITVIPNARDPDRYRPPTAPSEPRPGTNSRSRRRTSPWLSSAA